MFAILMTKIAHFQKPSREKDRIIVSPGKHLPTDDESMSEILKSELGLCSSRLHNED
jgi:hypothetical protein